MSSNTGFSPISDLYAKTLILGSMPSETSLQRQQYYAHDRNAFWPIMFALFKDNTNIERNHYEQCKALLIKNNIALWDVLQSCYRAGSLDTAIKMDTIIVNDFHQFFSRHHGINKVCFNGGKAESIYQKTVLPGIKEQFGTIQYCRLPSSSPAHAALSLQQKIDRWKNEIKGDKGDGNK